MIKRQIICAILVLLVITVSGAGVRAYTTQTPIRIDSNNDFSTYASSGEGTESNPWVFTDLDVNGSGYGYCIYVGNTTDYFTIEDSYLHDAYTNNPDDYYWPNSAIVFYNVENGLIEDNQISDNEWYGVYMYESSDNTVENNTLTGAWYGIYVMECSENNIVQYNNASSNSYSGITIDYSENNLVYRNTVDYNEIGINLYYFASTNTIEENLAFYNDYALKIDYFSDENTVLNNSFCLSYEYGVYIDSYSSDNEVYYNNFGNNTDQAYDSGSDNVWCAGYPDGGNYWTDYNGIDNYSGVNQDQPGSDGLGDTPYTDIDGGSGEDDYPLMLYVSTYGLGQRNDPSGLGQRNDPS